MKQTAVEKLGIAFRQWQTDWDSFDKIGKNQPASYDEFIAPFLEMEKEQIMDAYSKDRDATFRCIENVPVYAERYYNHNYKKKEMKFKVGDKVYKPKGYKFPGTVVAVFTTTSGDIRIVAEMDDNGMLHIFNENQLEKL
jgi:hypothetical protein